MEVELHFAEERVAAAETELVVGLVHYSKQAAEVHVDQGNYVSVLVLPRSVEYVQLGPIERD